MFVATGSSALAMREGAASRLTVQVIYQGRPCATAPDSLVAPAPVTAGTLMLRRGGHSVKASLAEGGPAHVALAGKGRISATLVLETPRVRVVEGASGSAADRISLGSKAARNGKVSFSVGSSLQNNGHVNTLIQLQRVAAVAERTSPKALRLVVAKVYDGPVAARPWTAFEGPDVIHVGRGPRGFQGTGDTDAQWEPAPIAHEYGHFLLETIAPDGSQGGDHDVSVSYPDRPNLAWGEGFPSAFAAVAIKEWGGRLLADCGKPVANYAEVPARPQLVSARDKRYAQYNETRVAGATYGLITHLGGGEAGLKRLLAALPGYHRDGHSVWTARDLRDLAAQQFEQSAADHAAIDSIFQGEGISWYRWFVVSVDFAAFAGSGAAYAVPELALRVTGPGGFDCRASGNDLLPTSPGAIGTLDGGQQVIGFKAADGGLSFSANDDCYLISGNGTPVLGDPPALVGLSATLPFPYLAGLAHWNGDFELRARYACFTIPPPPGADAKCPDTAPIDVTVDSRNDDSERPRHYNVSLGLGVEKTLVTFKADGKCDAIGSGAPPDCGF